MLMYRNLFCDLKKTTASIKTGEECNMS